MKTCTKCKLQKDEKNFSPTKGKYLYSLCKPCASKEMRERRKKNPLLFRGYELKKRFGITLEDFNKLLASQGNKCAACKLESSKWFVDHDHACCPTRKSCGKCIRAILCPSCNSTLGFSEESKSRLLSLVQYLDKFPPKTKIAGA